MEVIMVPSITALVYFLISLYKQVVSKECEICYRIIPLIAGVLGIILGIVAYYLAEGTMPAGNIISAMLIGGVSGLAATGANQAFKQLITKK